eukprot:CAMPEP_0172519326 /NCGR_PEP_ID=MMETSP1066-20121228/291352_1 /TAXON_ID=671091 /ORGANISM="Coscinodiscus wailesii, Strain CCMP2513" /LENGTH=299 /DNA_ID=CAMNT_0013301893 /DNA_START=118 /DNA_END=1017 /DNA_ORIENTATION=+
MLVFKNIAVATALGLITQFGNAESSSSLLGFSEERMSEMKDEAAKQVTENTKESLNHITEETDTEPNKEDQNDIFSIVQGIPDEAVKERAQSLLDNNDVDGAKEVVLEFIENYVSSLSDEEKANAESRKDEAIAIASAAFDKYKVENGGPVEDYAFEEERSEGVDSSSNLALAFAGDETERYFGPADGYAFEQEQSEFEEEQAAKDVIASKLYAYEQEQSAFEEEQSEGAGADSDLALAFAGGDETERYFGPADGYAFEQEQSEGADEKQSKFANALKEVSMAQDKIANMLKELEKEMP